MELSPITVAPPLSMPRRFLLDLLSPGTTLLVYTRLPSSSRTGSRLNPNLKWTRPWSRPNQVRSSLLSFMECTNQPIPRASSPNLRELCAFCPYCLVEYHIIRIPKLVIGASGQVVSVLPRVKEVTLLFGQHDASPVSTFYLNNVMRGNPGRARYVCCRIAFLSSICYSVVFSTSRYIWKVTT